MSSTYIPISLRKLVYKRANGCCEYCLIPESAGLVSHEIDHIIAEKHSGLTEAENLALSCTLCNQHKGSDIASMHPETGEIVRLYHPRRDRWADHFLLNNGEFIALSAIALVTIRLLQLNRIDRIEERQLLIEAKVIGSAI